MKAEPNKKRLCRTAGAAVIHMPEMTRTRTLLSTHTAALRPAQLERSPNSEAPLAEMTEIISQQGTEVDLSALDGFEGASAIQSYAASFRRCDLPPLQVAPPLDLFPDQPRTVPYEPLLRWDASEPWRHAEQAGVYLAYTEQKTLIYVGTSQRLAGRLYSYFGGGSSCVLKYSTWPLPPRYLATVAVPDTHKFEAPALEAYLIQHLNPPWNSTFRND